MSNTMPPPQLRSNLLALPNPLTLLVAVSTKPPLGIGHQNNLPWPPLKSDLAFFSRVTRRAPSTAPKDGPPTTSLPKVNKGLAEKKTLNVLIMGRKTYFSLPASRRPLVGRVSVVVTRDPGALQSAIDEEIHQKPPETLKGAEVLVVGGIQEAFTRLISTYEERLGAIFVVGGGEIYKSVLELGLVGTRVVMTEVRRPGGEAFECDTFFPVDLGREDGWKEVGGLKVGEWVGENVQEGWRSEGDGDGVAHMRVTGYEKVG